MEPFQKCIEIHHSSSEKHVDFKSHILNQVMFTTTGRTEDEGYKELVENKAELIKDQINDRNGVMMEVKKELSPGFTYGDLRDQIVKA